MLEDLKVLNGNLDLPFNEYIYEYTLSVDEFTTKLELEYKLCEDCNIEVIGNNLNNDENIVTLNVYTVDREVNYILNVYKEKEENVNGIDSYMQSLEVENIKEFSLYKVQLLTISIFVILLIIFSLIFKKKHN